MDLLVLQEFFSDYSIGTIVSAVIISAVAFFINKISMPKIVKGLCNLLPFVLGILFNYACSIIATKCFTFNSATFSAGLVSGSLSFAIRVLLTKIIKGEKLPKSKSSIIITSIIDGYVKKDNVEIVVGLIESVIIEKSNDASVNESEIITEIALHIGQNTVEGVNEIDVTALATLIFASVKQNSDQTKRSK